MKDYTNSKRGEEGILVILILILSFGVIDVYAQTIILEPVISITDGYVGFQQLDGAAHLAIVEIDSSTYALVAATTSNGVQIINMTNPENPTPVSSVTDGVGGFNTLAGAFGISTVTINSKVYALVTALADNGVQIIDITDPAMPIAVSSVIDGGNDGSGNTFDELDGAYDIATITIGLSTYALVTANDDDGVQIIDISNPATPTVASSITDNVDNFDTLDGARHITTVTINSKVYALVAASTDDGVQIIDISNPATPTAAFSIIDGGAFKLNGAFDITTVEIGSATYALVVSGNDDVQIINITDPTAPTAVSSLTDDVDGFDTIDSPNGITTVTIGESIYALVTSSRDDGVQIINITDPTNPAAVSSAIHGVDGFDLLRSVFDIDTIKSGSSTYALVTNRDFTDSGVQIIDITDPENPTAVTSITESGTFDELEGPSDIDIFELNIGTLAAIASAADDGVQIINLSNPANPIAISSVTDGVGGFNTLEAVSAVSIFPFASPARILATSFNEDGFQIIDISNAAIPTVIPAELGGADGVNTLMGPQDITSTVIQGGGPTAIVASHLDNAIQIFDISSIRPPRLLSTITDGSVDGNGNFFNELAGPFDTAIVTIDGSTYALVASFLDNGVQIINITSSFNPLATSDVTDGINGFNELEGAYDITTVVIDGSTYALVASLLDNGVQIIDITDPANPVATSSVTDGVDGFDTLKGASSITVVQSDLYTFALVASFGDNGVQAINITDPANPVAGSSIIDGSDGFDTLGGASSIASFVIGESTYVIVGSQTDNGIQILNTTILDPVATPEIPLDVSSVTDGDTFDTLDGASGITTVQIGLSTYALVASDSDDGVQIINISNPATPTATSSVSDGSIFDTLDGAVGITTVRINSFTYALVTANTDDGIQIINISNPTTPIAVASVSDGDTDVNNDTFDELDGARDITTVRINSFTYALVASDSDDGIQIINMTNPASPTAVSSVSDGGIFDTLDGATGITTVQMNASTYALVASRSDDGVQIIDITNPASPTAVASVSDGDTDVNNNTFDELEGARDITTVRINSSTYALVASDFDDGIQIIDITNPASPTAVSSVSDGGIFDTLDGAFGITTVQIGASTYALVASITDNGIQIIDITNPASPTAASSITDGSIFGTLDGAFGITTVQIDSSIYAIATGSREDGIQIILIAEDQPVGFVKVGSDFVLTANMIISQSNLPTITFNNATVNVLLDDTGKGVFEYASLIDSAVVTTKNLGSSVIQFTLDPDGPYNDRNPDQAGMPDEDPFEIQNFQSGVHTVIYNKTHFTFNFDDATFTGITPVVSFQASIHTAADALPTVNSDIANITFNIITTFLCEITITDSSLDFGTLSPGDISNEGTVAIQNSGNVNNNVKVGADFWCNASDDGCTGSNGVISPSQTSFGITTPNSPYASKQAFTDFLYDTDGGTLVRGTLTLPFLTPDLFTLTPDETDTVYLQTLVELIPLDGGSSNMFTGPISQEMIFESDCGG